MTTDWSKQTDDREPVVALLGAIKARMTELEGLLEESSSHWVYEDYVYRFYHHSFKVYGVQEVTRRIADTLQSLLPDRKLDDRFTEIVADGTGRRFEPEHNRRWLEVTRPMLEAFFHARYFLDMAVRYGRELDAAPVMMPSGWAALLYLYDLR